MSLSKTRFSLFRIFMCVVYFAAAPTWAAAISYDYKLVMNKNPKLCKHMEEVYKTHFKRPWDLEPLGGWEQLLKNDRVLLKTAYSRYPTSPEFSAIEWKDYMYKDEFGDRPLLIAEFDIDNDGTKDLVLKPSFFSGGNPDQWEFLLIFQPGELNLDQSLSRRDVWGEGKALRPKVISDAAVMRPFLFNGIAYLSWYDFYRYDLGEPKTPAHQPPEFMEIKKYKGGGIIGQREKLPLLLENICKFEMIRIEQP